jgi:hypothetical protein
MDRKSHWRATSWEPPFYKTILDSTRVRLQMKNMCLHHNRVYKGKKCAWYRAWLIRTSPHKMQNGKLESSLLAVCLKHLLTFLSRPVSLSLSRSPSPPPPLLPCQLHLAPVVGTHHATDIHWKSIDLPLTTTSEVDWPPGALQTSATKFKLLENILLKCEFYSTLHIHFSPSTFLCVVLYYTNR